MTNKIKRTGHTLVRLAWAAFVPIFLFAAVFSAIKLAVPACPRMICPEQPDCILQERTMEVPDCICAACPNVTVEPVPCYRVIETYTNWLDEVAASVYEERKHNGKESWDCDDMAEEQEKRIENTLKDTKAQAVCRTVYGELFINGEWVGHAYVKCDLKGIIFEATSGTIVNPWDYGDYRE